MACWKPHIYILYPELPFPTYNKMLISLTVGKVDAGVAVLLTEDKRLVNPPSPPLAP